MGQGLLRQSWRRGGGRTAGRGFTLHRRGALRWNCTEEGSRWGPRLPAPVVGAPLVDGHVVGRDDEEGREGAQGKRPNCRIGAEVDTHRIED